MICCFELIGISCRLSLFGQLINNYEKNWEVIVLIFKSHALTPIPGIVGEGNLMDISSTLRIET